MDAVEALHLLYRIEPGLYCWDRRSHWFGLWHSYDRRLTIVPTLKSHGMVYTSNNGYECRFFVDERPRLRGFIDRLYPNVVLLSDDSTDPYVIRARAAGLARAVEVATTFKEAWYGEGR